MELITKSLSDFLVEIAPQTDFSRNQIIKMAAVQSDDGKDLMFHVVDEKYKVTLESIDAYFIENPRPKKSMTILEENEFLRKKIKEMERKVGKPAEYIATEKGTIEIPAVKAADEVPARDTDIPEVKMKTEDFQKELIDEFKNKKPDATSKNPPGDKKKTPGKNKAL